MADANVSVSFSASTNDFVSQVSEAKDALQTFAAPFGEMNRQLVSFGTATSQAFSADRLTPYRDALSATQALQQSFAADSARAAAALREGDTLFDGRVGKISMEAIAFHQAGKDPFGAAVVRDVTKQLYPTPGEQP